MLKYLLISFMILIAPFKVFAQEGGATAGALYDSSSIDLPLNLYDSFTFEKETAAYVRNGLYIAAPSFFFLYGITTWGWSAGEGFELKPETAFGDNAVHGAADKFGHLYWGYIIQRFSAFLFRASGRSAIRAGIEGAVLSELITLGSEVGDGLSPDYGFDPYDVMFNNIGIVLGLILDLSPVLDRMFAIQIEYFPSKDMRSKFDLVDHHDLPTDYGGTKFLLSAKFSGIPYVSLTPFRYFTFDAGYYSRGYDQSDLKNNTRNVYLGISINLSIAFGDLLPAGYASSTIQSVFNYIHPPLDYEFYRYVISSTPHEAL